MEDRAVVSEGALTVSVKFGIDIGEDIAQSLQSSTVPLIVLPGHGAALCENCGVGKTINQ